MKNNNILMGYTNFFTALYYFTVYYTHPNFSKIVEFLPKVAKHKFASISLTIGHRMILSEFLMYRVTKQYNLPNFALVKNVSYFEFFTFSLKVLKQNILEKKKIF